MSLNPCSTGITFLTEEIGGKQVDLTFVLILVLLE